MVANTVKTPGNTNSLSGNGTVNALKLFIPTMGNMHPTVAAAFRQVIQHVNSLTQTALTTVSHTYSVSGTLAVPSGATNYLPPFFRPVGGNQGVTLSAVRYFCRAGTATFTIYQNGAALTGAAAGINVTTTATTTTLNVSTSNNDYFAPVLTAVSGSDGLSISFEFTVTS